MIQTYADWSGIHIMNLRRQATIHFHKKVHEGRINNPDASIGVCCSHKVIALSFNTLCYDAERRGIKPSARINTDSFVCALHKVFVIWKIRNLVSHHFLYHLVILFQDGAFKVKSINIQRDNLFKTLLVFQFLFSIELRNRKLKT